MPVVVAPGSLKVSRTLRMLMRLAAVSLLLLGVAGCGSGGVGTPAAQVRVVHAAADTGSLDVYSGTAGSTGAADSAGVAYNLSFGSVTSYAPVPVPASKLFAVPTGTRTAMAGTPFNRSKAKQYTLLIDDGDAAALHAEVFTDQSQPAAPGQASLRFVQEAAKADALDLYLVPVNTPAGKPPPLVLGISPGRNSGYMNVPAGTYTLYVMVHGMPLRTSGMTLYMGAATTYASGAAYTIVLMDQPAADIPAVQAVLLDDYVPALALQ